MFSPGDEVCVVWREGDIKHPWPMPW